MAFSEEQLESLARKIEERERRARRVAWVVTIIPIVLAGMLLAYTIQQISIKQNDLDQKTIQLANVNTKIPEGLATLGAVETAKSQLQTANVQLQTAKAQLKIDLFQAQVDLATATIEIGQAQEILNAGQSFEGNACQFSAESVKAYSSSYTPQNQMLLFLLEMQYRGVPWNADGFSVSEGFDSPNFAIFALQNRFVEQSDNYKKGNLPWNFLSPISSSWPQNGDIVYYKSGYTMFYFELPIAYGNPKTRPCVIGMTPLGILSQTMEFAEWIGFLKVPYKQR